MAPSDLRIFRRQGSEQCPAASLSRAKRFSVGRASVSPTAKPAASEPSLLVFVYDKHDDAKARTARLNILHTIFVQKERTADFQTTSGLVALLKNQANREDLLAFFAERMLPVDEITAGILADEVLQSPPPLGYLTISNALQWRLQYSRAIEQAGSIDGLLRIK